MNMPPPQDAHLAAFHATRSGSDMLVLPTPDAVASHYVEWEWETALTLEKRVIPLLVKRCAVPEELQRIQYHRLDGPDQYKSGQLRLGRATWPRWPLRRLRRPHMPRRRPPTPSSALATAPSARTRRRLTWSVERRTGPGS